MKMEERRSYSNEGIIEVKLIADCGRVKRDGVTRECPLEVAKMLLFSMLLGGGILIGTTFTLVLHTSSGYFFPSFIPTTTTKLVVGGGGGGSGGGNINTSTTITSTNASTSIAPSWKVAFMFLVRGPLPLGLLWERFFHNSTSPCLYSIYVHASPGFTLNLSSSSVFYARFIPSQQVQWGDITMYDAEKRLLENALLDPLNNRFVLLSESCIPLHSFQTVYNYLMSSHHSFIGSYDERGRRGRGRYSKRMSPRIKLKQWRKGSQWFEMSRKLAIYVVGETYYYSKFKDYCKPSCIVDEHYLPTILSIKFKNEMANRSITWVNWFRGGAHPTIFEVHDITKEFLEMIRMQRNCTYNNQPSNICFLFARKFSPNSLEPLLNLSHSVIGI